MSNVLRQTDGVYSPFKFIHHPDRIAALREGKQTIPLQVHLVLSDVCNHRCSFCAYRTEGSTSSELFIGRSDGPRQLGPRRQIPVNKCRDILADCASMGVRAIQFTGGGEPLAHPCHKDVFIAAKELGLDIALVTNGTLMTDATLEALEGAAWIRMSLDAATATTYASLRGVHTSVFGRALKTVRNLVTLRDRSGGKTLIGVGFVVTKENYRETYDAVALASRLGADNIRISAAFMPEGYEYHKSFHAQVREEVHKAKEDFEGNAFRVFDLYGGRLEDLRDQNPSSAFCGYMHLVTYIGADLNVYRCCVLAYSRAGLIGSLANRSLKELWESEAKQKNFEDFDARQCSRCMFNTKNQFIEYCISDRPMHVNYV